MKRIIKTIIFLITMLNASVSLHALNWMEDSYWFAGNMTIHTSFDHVTYQLYYYDTDKKIYKLSPVKFEANKQINIQQLMGGIKKCPYMWCCDENDQGTSFVLVPDVPYTDFTNQAGLQQHQLDLKSGKILSYIVVSRQAEIISICIVGPFTNSAFNAQKLSFNTIAFENIWVVKSPWYTTLKEHSPGMIFAFSFNADFGYFAKSRSVLSDDAFYISGITDFEWPNGWSWTQQGNRPSAPAKDISGMTMQKLSQQGIVNYQKPFVNLDELQAAIDFINWTGQGNFANVIPGHKSTIGQQQKAINKAQNK